MAKEFKVTEKTLRAALISTVQVSEEGKYKCSVKSITDYHNTNLDVPSKLVNVTLTTEYKANRALESLHNDPGDLNAVYKDLFLVVEILQNRDGSFKNLPIPGELVEVMIKKVFSANIGEEILIASAIKCQEARLGSKLDMSKFDKLLKSHVRESKEQEADLLEKKSKKRVEPINEDTPF